MSNSFFSFKQFTIYQDRCAMKVGTDGVLLGTWTPIHSAKHVLDVGTGTGLISLILAQRNSSINITAIEIDTAAAQQAEENVAHSPWADRIKVECCDFRFFKPKNSFDLIISNPPYFVDAMKCPDIQRCMARHAGSLNYELLFAQSARLLAPEGKVSVIVPAEAEKNVVDAAWNNRLYPQCRTNVYTKPGKPCRRILFLFGFQDTICQTYPLFIEQDGGGYTSEYTALTKDFYLKM